MQVPQKLSSIFKFEQNYKTRAKILSEGSFLTVVFFFTIFKLETSCTALFLKIQAPVFRRLDSVIRLSNNPGQTVTSIGNILNAFKRIIQTNLSVTLPGGFAVFSVL